MIYRFCPGCGVEWTAANMTSLTPKGYPGFVCVECHAVVGVDTNTERATLSALMPKFVAQRLDCVYCGKLLPPDEDNSRTRYLCSVCFYDVEIRAKHIPAKSAAKPTVDRIAELRKYYAQEKPVPCIKCDCGRFYASYAFAEGVVNDINELLDMLAEVVKRRDESTTSALSLRGRMLDEIERLERLRTLTASDAVILVDAGAYMRKAPRKARNKMMQLFNIINRLKMEDK